MSGSGIKWWASSWSGDSIKPAGVNYPDRSLKHSSNTLFENIKLITLEDATEDSSLVVEPLHFQARLRDSAAEGYWEPSRMPGSIASLE